MMSAKPAQTCTAKIVQFQFYAVAPAADGVQMVTVYRDPQQEAGALLDATVRAAEFRRARERADRATRD
jgi:hypothetical protein